MSETLQSAHFSPGKHLDVFAARLPDKTAGFKGVLFSSSSSGDEIQSLLHADREAWRKSSNKLPGAPPYSTARLISENKNFETSPLNLNLYSNSSTIKKIITEY